jgi:hypothetical protein
MPCTAEPQVPKPSAFGVEILIGKRRRNNWPGNDQNGTEFIQTEVKHSVYILTRVLCQPCEMLKVQLFCDVTPCRLVNSSWCVKGSYCLCSGSISPIRHPHQLYPEDEGNTMYRNVKDYSANDTSSHTRRRESPAAPL